MDKIEIRVTRPSFYPRNCQNPEFMEGHYYRANSYNEACQKAKNKFPSEPLNIKVFKLFIDGEWIRQ